MTSRILTSLLLAALAAGPVSDRADAQTAKKVVLPTTIAFDSSLATSETRIALADVTKGFPRDWSKHEALVLEVRASSPQRIHLKVYVRGGAPGPKRFSRVLFHPYPGVWLRAAIPVSLLAQPPATGNDMVGACRP